MDHVDRATTPAQVVGVVIEVVDVITGVGSVPLSILIGPGSLVETGARLPSQFKWECV